MYDGTGRLILVGRESNVEDDRPNPNPGQGSDLDDLNRGTVGTMDPFIGPVHLPESTDETYYVAVSSQRQLPNVLWGTLSANVSDAIKLTRLEPVNSVTRIAEDHVGFQGYTSSGAQLSAQVDPVQTQGLFDISNEIKLSTNVRPFNLGDVPLFISAGGGDTLQTANPFQGGQVVTLIENDLAPGNNPDLIKDIVMRSDGQLYGYRRLNNNATDVGAMVTINAATGALGGNQIDNIPDRTPTPTNIYNDNIATTSDEPDALTFDRTGENAAGVPSYYTYYAVREADQASFDTVNLPNAISSKLYRANADGNASRPNPNPDGYGIRGDIQEVGVTKATVSILVLDNDNNGDTATIQIEAKEAGTNGNGVTVQFFASNRLFVSASLFSRTVFVELNVNATGDVTNSAQAIVDAINSEANARRLITAGLTNPGSDFGEEGQNLPGRSFVTAGGVGTPLNGYVTGLAFSDFHGNQLYGITNAGEFLEINKSSAG